MKKVILCILFICSCLQITAENYPYRSDYLWLTVPDHADWLYKTGEKAKVEVTFCKYGIPQDVEVSYEIGQDMLPATASGKVMLKNGRATIDMGTMKKPGFLDLRMKAFVGDKTYEHHVKVGFSPELLTPYTKNPADFDAFWQKNLEEARKEVKSEKLIVKSEKVEKYITDDTDCYLLKIKTDQRHSIYGYLTKPKAAGKYPVVLCPPGAGSQKIYPSDYFPKLGCIYMKIEIHDNDQLMTDDAYNEMRQKKCDGYMRRGMASRDTYYYKDVYVGCARALDFLCSLPEWDGRNAIVTGGSQGGALTIITAALNEKATVCAPFYPALCDLTGCLHHRAGGWPKFFSGFYKDGKTDIPDDQAVATLQYYDVVNFARQLTIPTFMSWGYSDDTCSPTSVWAAWNEISAPKEKDITPSSGHWRFPSSWEKCWQWIKNQMR